MKKTLLFLVAGFFFLNNLPAQKPIEQKEIRLVQYMPNIPFPYKMKNWKRYSHETGQTILRFQRQRTELTSYLVGRFANKLSIPYFRTSKLRR